MVDDVALVLVVPVERAVADAETCGDVCDPGGVIAALGEALECSFDDFPS